MQLRIISTSFTIMREIGKRDKRQIGKEVFWLAQICLLCLVSFPSDELFHSHSVNLWTNIAVQHLQQYKVRKETTDTHSQITGKANAVKNNWSLAMHYISQAGLWQNSLTLVDRQIQGQQADVI